MAEQLPQNFVIPQEPTIATYSYTDIADGTGVVKLYGCQTDTRTASGARLSSIQTFTSRAYITGAAAPQFKDFDLSPFNTPRTAKGTAIVEAGLLINGAASCAVWFDIKKVDVSGTPTTIVSAEAISEDTSAGVPEYHNLVVPLTIPKTDFKVGESLRLTARLYSAGAFGLLGTDPKGELWSGETSTIATPACSQLILNMPFKLQL